MQDRPDAAELLEAVADFLFSDVRGWVSGQHRFQVLVAANSCAIVARELRGGDGSDRADLELFRELLGEPEAGSAAADVASAAREAADALAARIRSGAADESLGPVVTRLRDHVARKLEVTRPGYTGTAAQS